MATAKKALDGTVLDRLYKVIESRRGADPSVSNTARLFAKGTEKIAQKLGEEAVETLIEGTVDSMSYDSGTPVPTVNGIEVSLGDILRVQAATGE